jgi:hypothetical protein
LTTFSVRPLSNTTGIDDTNIGSIINTNHIIPMHPELTSDCGGFGEVQLAAKGMEGDSPHRYEKELPDICGQLFPILFILLRV